jgi:hypothetical protein
MDRENAIYPINLHEQDLTGLAELCANVARNVSANRNQTDSAHSLRMEWVQLGSSTCWTTVIRNLRSP